MPLTRGVLYALVWSEPMLKVAARYDVCHQHPWLMLLPFYHVPQTGTRIFGSHRRARKAPLIPPLPEHSDQEIS